MQPFPFRALVQSVVQPPSRNPLRQLPAWAKQRATLARLHRTRGIRPLGMLDADALRRSDRLYILGSGASVAGYTDAQWADIARHDSVGFNSWIVHDFVPSFYVMEYVAGISAAEAFLHNLALREEAYRGVPLLFQSRVSTQDGTFVERLPPALRAQVHMIPQVFLPGRTVPELTAWARILRQMGLFGPSPSVPVVFARAASIVLLTLLGVRLGYKHLVLCGVDLNDTRYFYEVDEARYRALGRAVPVSGQLAAGVHKTNDPQRVHGGIPVMQVIEVLLAEVFRPLGVTLDVGSEASALCGLLPYHWRAAEQPAAPGADKS